jgi:hypothetical protein
VVTKRQFVIAVSQKAITERLSVITFHEKVMRNARFGITLHQIVITKWPFVVTLRRNEVTDPCSVIAFFGNVITKGLQITTERECVITIRLKMIQASWLPMKRTSFRLGGMGSRTLGLAELRNRPKYQVWRFYENPGDCRQIGCFSNALLLVRN